MGLLRSQTNVSGHTINGILLGDPVAPVRVDGSPAQVGDNMADLFWGWDDAALPSGTVEVVDGEPVVTPDA